MKKHLLLVFTLIAWNVCEAQTCTANSSFTTPGIHPDTATNLASGCKGQAYNESFTFVVPKDTVVSGFNFTINFMQIDSISGLPPGISYACNPGNCTFPGNTKGCINLYGTLPAAGVYDLVLYVHGQATNAILGSYTITTPYKGYRIKIGEIPVLTSGASNASCQSNNGMAWVKASGNSNYFYTWNTNPITYNDTLYNAPAGIYIVGVTDLYGCADVDTVIVENLGGPVIDSLKTNNVLCFGGQSGSATVYTSGGNGNNTISWSSGQSSQTVTGLSAGAYTVKIKDQLGCETSAPVNITEPTAIFADLVATDVDCYGNANGEITALISGGTPGYNYSWNPGGMQTLQNAGPGIYTLSITDANGCQASFKDTIFEPAPLSVNATITHVKCFGESNGAVNISASGGNAGYSYVWSNGKITANITSLPAASYYLEVKDNKGCTRKDTFQVAQPALLTLSSAATNEMAGDDGSIDLTVNGGTPPYRYEWDNGDSIQDPQNLGAGVYLVTVTDSNGCTETLRDTIYFPAGLNLASGNAWNIYPNPGNGIATVSFAGNYEGTVLITVYDMRGKEIAAIHTVKTVDPLVQALDIRSAEKGVYLVSVRLGNGDIYFSRWIKTQ